MEVFENIMALLPSIEELVGGLDLGIDFSGLFDLADVAANVTAFIENLTQLF